MKKLGFIILTAGITLQGYTQNVNNNIDILERLESDTEYYTTNDTLDISYSDFQEVHEAYPIFGETDFQEMPEVAELESIDEDYDSDFKEIDNESRNDYVNYYSSWNKSRKRFRGHWVGMGAGFSSYVIDDGVSAATDVSYMTLNTNKSFSYQLNFVQTSIGLSRNFGFVSGLGLSWQNYRFEGNNSIQKNLDGPVTPFYIMDEANNYVEVKKSTFNVAYLTLPILAEVHVTNSWYFSGGPVGAMKIGSWTKMVLKSGEKYQNDSDFDLNMFMLGATLRVSYEAIQLYATSFYTPFCTSPLFKSTKTPGGHNFYPIEIGLNIMF